MLSSFLKCTPARKYRELRRRVFHFKNSLFDTRPKFLLLAYHRVLPQVLFNPLNTIISFKTFVGHVEWLKNKFPIISLMSAIEQCRKEKAAAEVQIILSFDDGYADNYCYVFNCLKQKRIPAVFFVPTDYIGGYKPLWEWELIAFMNRMPATANNISIKNDILSRLPGETRLMYSLRVFKALKLTDSKYRQDFMLDFKEKQKDIFFAYSPADRVLNWQELKEMSEAGMEIGSHSLSHTSLTAMSFNDAENEIIESKKIIENKIKKTCDHFAFPFGSKTDFNNDLIECVKNAGYHSCVLNVHGYNFMHKNKFCFSRITMDEELELKYLLG